MIGSNHDNMHQSEIIVGIEEHIAKAKEQNFGLCILEFLKVPNFFLNQKLSPVL